MDKIYLQKVLVYLQQEFPQQRQQFRFEEGKIVLHIEARDSSDGIDNHWREMIIESISRIRNRDRTIQFGIRSGDEKYDFEI